MLTLIPTPIGNLKDISMRAIEALQAVDGIICEDSRHASILLNHYEIKKPLIVLNDFNESKTLPLLLDRLKSGENLALISDAGTPLISDPGYKIVRECLQNNIPVDSLPGPVAAIVALTLSSLPPDKFLFLGYLPEKTSHRLSLFDSLAQISRIQKMTFIGYIAPFKLKRPLEEISQLWPNIQITLAKELTKIHQRVASKTALEWLEDFKKNPPKGEYVLLFRLDSI